MAQLLHEAVGARIRQVGGFIEQMHAPLATTMAELEKTQTWLNRARRFHRVPLLGGFAESRAKAHQDKAASAQGQQDPLMNKALAVYKPQNQ